MSNNIKVLAALLMHGAILMPCLAGSALAQDRPFRNVVVTEVDIGEIPRGRYAFRATITTVDPHAEIPDHVHNNPGIRYMLEGALTIHWKDKGSQTFSAGSTYFEGPGSNHPAGVMAASNPLETPARVLIIELLPKQ